MTNIKTQYQELYTLLETSKNKKVSTVLPELIKLMESKVASKTFITDAEGNVVAVYCYYHKQWELVEHVPYGAKKHSKSGLNTMCKAGVNQWTKQQKEFKATQLSILDKLTDNELTSEEAKSYLETAEELKSAIVPIDSGYNEYCFDSADKIPL